MPKRSRAQKSSRRRRSQIANANMPLSRGSASGPHSPYACEQDLRVARAVEAMPSRPELPGELEVVVDLAVVGDPLRAVRRGHRPVAGRGQVEDRQPPVAERHGRVDEHAGVVRAAVAERVGHRRDEQLAALESRGQVDRAGDAAHATAPAPVGGFSTAPRPGGGARRTTAATGGRNRRPGGAGGAAAQVAEGRELDAVTSLEIDRESSPVNALP